MSRLRDSFDKWQAISETVSKTRKPAKTNSAPQCSEQDEWLDETHELLQKLNKQLHHLSS